MVTNLEKQLAEIEALKATYSQPEEFFLTEDEEEVLRQARRCSEVARPCYEHISTISGSIKFLNRWINGGPLALRFTLPHNYPAESPDLLVVSDTADRATHDRLTRDLAKSLEDSQGSEVLILAAEFLRDIALHISESQPHTDQEQTGNTALEAGVSSSPAPRLARKLIWFHHVKSITKRKNIVSWAQEMGIRGFSKPGFPGIVVCEGYSEQIEEFYGKVKGMRWQAIAVRGEEVEEVVESTEKHGQAVPWRFQGKFEELGENEMHVLAAHCTRAGLEPLFLTSLKL